jgi:hypothetical protein
MRVIHVRCFIRQVEIWFEACKFGKAGGRIRKFLLSNALTERYVLECFQGKEGLQELSKMAEPKLKIGHVLMLWKSISETSNWNVINDEDQHEFNDE